MLKENNNLESKVWGAYGTSKRRLSAWKLGVMFAAITMIHNAKEALTYENCEKVLLNGAKDWQDYSYGNMGLVHDYQIVEAYCTPSQRKRANNGAKRPNKKETWKDIQAKALYEAFLLIQEELLFQKGTSLNQE